MPCDGPLETLKVNASPSRSVPLRTMFALVSSASVTDPGIATGASLTGVTVMLTIAAALFVCPLLMMKAKLSLPK